MSANKGKKSGRLPRKARPKVEEIRTWIYEYLPGGAKGYLRKISEEIDLVPNVAMRVRLRIEFLQFFIPKLKAVEVTNTEAKQNIQLTFVKQDGTTEVIGTDNDILEAAVQEALED